MMKLTNVKALEMVLGMAEVQANVELVEKLTQMLNQFAKKNKSGSSTPTKAQQENVKIKEVIIEVLGKYEEPKQVKDLISENSELGSYTGQKISALMKQLVEEGQVSRIADKKVTLFALALI